MNSKDKSRYIDKTSKSKNGRDTGCCCKNKGCCCDACDQECYDSIICHDVSSVIDTLSLIKEALIEKSFTAIPRLVENFFSYITNSNNLIVTNSTDETITGEIDFFTEVYGYGVTVTICGKKFALSHKIIYATNQNGDVFTLNRLISPNTDLNEADKITYFEVVCQLINCYKITLDKITR